MSFDSKSGFTRLELILLLGLVLIGTFVFAPFYNSIADIISKERETRQNSISSSEKNANSDANQSVFKD